jgi:hypothetical protein
MGKDNTSLRTIPSGPKKKNEVHASAFLPYRKKPGCTVAGVSSKFRLPFRKAVPRYNSLNPGTPNLKTRFTMFSYKPGWNWFTHANELIFS